MIIHNNRFKKINNNPKLNSIAIPYNVDVKNIRISLKDHLNFLTLEDKLKLYQYLIKQEKFYKNTDSIRDSKAMIDILKNEKMKNEDFDISKYLNANNIYQGDAVFIGIRDYNKYVRGTNLENRVIRNKISAASYIDISKIDKDAVFTHNDLKMLNDVVFKQNQSEELSRNEIINLQEQLVICYKDSIIRNGIKPIVPVSVELNLNKDGYINTKRIKITIIDRYNRYAMEDYDRSINVAKNAIVLCNPFKNLPLLKYKSWEKVNFVFET
jgi:hypothetical protein